MWERTALRDQWIPLNRNRLDFYWFTSSICGYTSSCHSTEKHHCFFTLTFSFLWKCNSRKRTLGSRLWLLLLLLFHVRFSVPLLLSLHKMLFHGDGGFAVLGGGKMYSMIDHALAHNSQEEIEHNDDFILSRRSFECRNRVGCCHHCCQKHTKQNCSLGVQRCSCSIAGTGSNNIEQWTLTIFSRETTCRC